MEEPNIGEPERFASAIVGGMLILTGLGRRSFGGLALAAVGAAFVARGVTGQSDMYRSLRRSALLQAEDDTIDEASDESFPASDAPSWTATTSTGAPDHHES